MLYFLEFVYGPVIIVITHPLIGFHLSQHSRGFLIPFCVEEV